jgi:hypothetical protein
MRITLVNDLINRKKIAGSLETLQAEVTNEINFAKCIECPGLCFQCIKHLFGISTGSFETGSCRLVYVLSGRIKLIFPYANLVKELDANGLMLIPHETKVVIENKDGILANFVMKYLDAVKEKLTENMDPWQCSMGRMIST